MKKGEVRGGIINSIVSENKLLQQGKEVISNSHRPSSIEHIHFVKNQELPTEEEVCKELPTERSFSNSTTQLGQRIVVVEPYCTVL